LIIPIFLVIAGAYGLNFDRTNAQLLAHYPTVLPGCSQADIIGSPYAPTGYNCNPQLGSNDDLAWLKKTLNGMGLKLMLDFVPNHSAVDGTTQFLTQPHTQPHIFLSCFFFNKNFELFSLLDHHQR